MKREKRAISGVLLLDKPVGISSNAALTRAKIVYGAAKAGHTGTLDPFASGLLPICFGEATKFAGFMLAADKTYEAVLRLGRTTTTGDPEGQILTESQIRASAVAIAGVLRQFTGPVRQVPPMHSAIKVHGQPLYQLARRGVEIPREARDVQIHRLELLDVAGPLLTLHVVCSKGTYIRVLAEDIGKALGCGGMLEQLRRTHTASFALANAVSLDALSAMAAEARDARLLPTDSLVAHLPRLDLTAEQSVSLLEGRVVAPCDGLPPGAYRIYGAGGDFAGLVEANAGGLKARRMMSRREG